MTEEELAAFLSDLSGDFSTYLNYWKKNRPSIRDSYERMRIPLPEHVQVPLPTEDNPYGIDGFSEDAVQELASKYSETVNITFPAENPDGVWQLVNQGYAGAIVLSGGWTLELQPKVSFDNILAVEAYTGGLESFEFRHRITKADSIEGIYERLADILVKEVISLGNTGLDKSYETREYHSTIIQGRIDFVKSTRRAWDPRLHFQKRELTADTENNRIILWTLYKILESGQLSNETRHKIRRAYKILENHVTLSPISPQDCLTRTYSRQNVVYEKIHGLCYFFLKAIGPTIRAGERTTIPYTVHMPTLYEEFVSKWLRTEFLPDYEVEAGLDIRIDEASGKSFELDFLVLKDGKPVCIMDTKYKVDDEPETSDLQQLSSYASTQGLNEAILIHPNEFEKPMNMWVGQVRIRDLIFPVSSEIEVVGQEFNDRFRSLSKSFVNQY